MTGGEILSLITGLTALAGVVLVFITNRRANATNEKKLTLEEQQAEDAREDKIAERRLGELNRLYERVAVLEKTVEQLLERDRQKQATIDTQADDLDRTNDALDSIRSLFIAFVRRVETAWKDGHTMPTLTEDEQALLEMTLPASRLRTTLTREKD